MNYLVATFSLISIAGCNSASMPFVDSNAPSIVNAAQRGDIDTVKSILDSDPAALNHTDENGNTAASWAILNDHHEIAIFLVENGYPVNAETEGDFPLIMSCLSRYTQGSRDMLKYLLENGADPNVVYEPEGWVPLNMAANNGQEENVRLLVQHGAKFDSKDRQGQTALEMAKERVAEFRNPEFNYPHGELSDPKVRKDAIKRWERMVDLLTELEEGG